MPTDDCDVPDPAIAPPASAERDRALPRRAALTGMAALAGSAAVAAFTGPAAAQTDTSTSVAPEGSTPATDAAPSTTAPPKKPTASDVALLGFAQSIELAAAQLYSQAVPVLGEELQPTVAVFRRHHQAYGEQIGALLGRRAPGVANQTLVSELTPAFGARSETAVLRAAHELENSLAASYTQLLGELKGTDGVALIASIQPIEARQAVVLGQAIGAAPTELMPVLEGDEAGATVFTPSQYPVV